MGFFIMLLILVCVCLTNEISANKSDINMAKVDHLICLSACLCIDLKT